MANIRKQKIHQKVLLLAEFYKKYGRLPKAAEEYQGVKIGRFFYNVNKGCTKIDEQDKEILDDVGCDIFAKNIRERIKHQKILLLAEFYKKYGRIPKVKEEYQGIKIGNFYNRIRLKVTNISEVDKKMLEDLGFDFSTKVVKVEVHEKVLLLNEFYKKYGRYPKMREQYKGKNIGAFYYCIKSNKTKITVEDRKLLEDVGFDFSIYNPKDKAKQRKI